MTPVSRQPRCPLSSTPVDDGRFGFTRQALHHLSRSASQLTELLEHVLDRSVAHQRLVVWEVVEDIVESARLTSDASVEVDVDESIWIYANASLLRRSASNLLDNAIRAAGESGRVRFVLHSQQGAAVIVVEDSGPGFGTSLHGRASLGLSVVAELVGNVQGSFEIRRSELGGTLLRITVPYRSAEPMVERWGVRMRILLCDDHVLFCDALRSALVPQGHEVHSCFRPQDAVELTRCSHFDVVVMDLGFPEGYEIDAVAAIKAVLAHDAGTAVVVLVRNGGDRMLLDAVHAGAAALCSKSQRLQEIVGVIQRAGAARGRPPGRARLPGCRGVTGDERALAAFLTPREYEVLRRLVLGQSTHTIAAELGVSYSTSRTHIQNVLVKLGVHSRLSASAFAVRNHLMDDVFTSKVPAQLQGEHERAGSRRCLGRVRQAGRRPPRESQRLTRQRSGEPRGDGLDRRRRWAEPGAEG